MDDAQRRARMAAAARARRQDPAVRAREAAAKRARRLADPETVRANDAAAKRALRSADPGMREREAAAQRARRLADPETVRANDAAAKRALRAADPERREREAAAKRARRRADLDGARAREVVTKRRQWAREASRRRALGEAPPAADGVKAQTVRVHRTERRWPLVTCRHHSTSAAETLGVATADFSAVFPDIDFTQAVEAGCDKPPFIEASVVSTTCQVEPWRGLQDKCVGEYEAVLQHAEQSCQTEHHITLVQCAKPQVSSCSVEVQADDLWWQHHCGTGPIGVDLCET
ncbi:uncharacterized protein LOC119453068 isoform X12 [Dermacentor silvarum]|uniref:uncharacterized protein LOC119453068 isoform X12 n=1 Tax=Dermacentor silvarum TaxID=543639 RepID=UPI002100B455|nr:uncharacterized protein LOC119453068 isoform X12 [Dermacentor silvarum]